MFRTSFIIALGLFVGAARPQQEASNNTAFHVSQRAVWPANNGTVRQARESCQTLAFPQLGACFVKQMQQSGASAEAVAFIRRLENQAFLQKFQDTGRVDIAWILYPFRANENSGCLLVNGTPWKVDVDDLSQLPRVQLNANSAWKSLVAAHPRATLWSGDRSGFTGVTPARGPNGGQRFVVDYRVLDGCHACARLGVVHYAFDFDATGKFLGAAFVDVQAARA